MNLRHIILAVSLLAGTVASGQGFKIGIIDFYGLHKVPEARVRKALGVSEGENLPRSKGDMEEKAAAVPGIVQARIEATCCDESGRAILYVGVEERGAPHFDLRVAPESEVLLPEVITVNYREFLEATASAARRGITAEDLRNGHSLMADPDVRNIQLRFVELAGKYLTEIRSVLRNAGDDEQRAMAAYVIGYAPNKKEVIDDLQYALKDPDDTVRGNAIRALAAITVYATLHPDGGIKIPATWFVEMANSVSWTDRNNATVALVNLTEGRNQVILDQLRERALPALVEMARWKHLAHALPSFILVGRVAGLPEKEIQEAWAAGDRDKVINAATGKKK